MISNFLRIGWRNISRHKLYSGINIGGLALGLAVGILLLVWVQDELSYDRFHKNGENIYRVSVSLKSGNDVQTWGGLSAPFGPMAVKNIAGVQATVRTREGWLGKYTYDNKDFFDVADMYVEPTFFTMFNFPIVKGDPKKPFLNKQSIVVTRSAAKKYFGTEDVIGKTILVQKTSPFTVSGVIDDFPHNSDFKGEIFFNFEKLKDNYTGKDYWKSLEEDWGNYTYLTYLQLAPGTSPAKVGKQMETLRTDVKVAGSQTFNLLPLHRAHLYNLDLSEGGIKIVRIFLIIAIVILLIACVNYVNLSTARAMQRAGEIGIRKMIGAARRQLFLQFLWESLLIFSIALLLAIVMIVLFIPLYNNITSKELSFSFANLQMVTAIGLAMLVTLLVAGIYPAVLLSSFNPLKTLKGIATMGGKNISFRKALVVLQFGIATVMIISTLIVGQQLRYIRSRALGYNKENVFHFDPGSMEPHFKDVQQELITMPGVHGVSAANQDLLDVGNMTGDTKWEGKDEAQTLIVRAVGSDETFMSMMDFKMAAGVPFTGVEKDSGNYVINETAAKAMGMKDPVGKKFRLWESDGLIVGVVKDFHYTSLHEKIAPLIFYYSGSKNAPTGYRIYVKTTGADAAKAIASAKTLYDRYNPGAHPFRYTFVDESLDKMYRTDQRTGKLFNYFAGIAIFISCLGLFGLATFATAQRVKEIGIRKVLGASVSNIITLLSADFLKTVLIAIIFSVPVAWYIMHKWLEDYAYNVGIDWKVFVFAGSIAIVIAFLTVSFQAIKAAIMNPVKSLKTE